MDQIMSFLLLKDYFLRFGGFIKKGLPQNFAS